MIVSNNGFKSVKLPNIPLLIALTTLTNYGGAYSSNGLVLIYSLNPSISSTLAPKINILSSPTS